MKSRLTC